MSSVGHAHPLRDSDHGLPLSVMANSAVARLVASLVVIALLWLAVAWAVAQP